MTDDELRTNNIFKQKAQWAEYQENPIELHDIEQPKMSPAEALRILAENSMGLATDQYGEVARKMTTETQEAAQVLRTALGLDQGRDI